MTDANYIVSNLLAFVAMFAASAAWLTSLWHADNFFLFLAALFIPPVGVIHGLLIWVGAVA